MLKPPVLCLFVDSKNLKSIAILHHKSQIVAFDYIFCVHSSFLLAEVSNCLSSSFISYTIFLFHILNLQRKLFLTAEWQPESIPDTSREKGFVVGAPPH